MVHDRAGNGPIRFDCSQMKPEDVETMRPRAGWMGLNDKKLRELGIDFFGRNWNGCRRCAIPTAALWPISTAPPP
ncbi:MAG: hypothetical protein ACLUPV_06945 [Bilophila wadsworthia]